jgi:UDP-galactopyranose mutase
MRYNYLIVGSGLFGATLARQLAERGEKVLIVEKNDHIGGHVYTKKIEGTHVHMHGPHIFNTNKKEIWNYVNKFAEFIPYQHKVIAAHQRKMYSLPFNMRTFHQFWGVTHPGQAMQKLKSVQVKIENPRNLEEWALSRVGKEIYETLI